MGGYEQAVVRGFLDGVSYEYAIQAEARGRAHARRMREQLSDMVVQLVVEQRTQATTPAVRKRAPTTTVEYR